jgi:hypothetical protein
MNAKTTEDTPVTSNRINATPAYMKWCKERVWNVGCDFPMFVCLNSIFLYAHCVQTGSGALSAYYPMSIGFFLGGRAVGA